MQTFKFLLPPRTRMQAVSSARASLSSLEREGRKRAVLLSADIIFLYSGFLFRFFAFAQRHAHFFFSAAPLSRWDRGCAISSGAKREGGMESKRF